jgi:hypothetical protein
MTTAIIGQPMTANQMLQEAQRAPQAQEAPKEPGQTASDSAQISNDAKPAKSEKLEKFKNWLKNKINDQQKELTTADKVKRVAISTAFGAGSGALMIATGTAPLVSAIVGTALGAVAMGGLGLFVGFIGGMIAEKAGHRDAMGKGALYGAIGGGLAGAGIGGVSGWAQGHFLVSLANALGGGPVGGAIAGGLFSAASATLSILRRSEQKPAGQDQQNGTTPPQQPAPPAAPETKPAQP